MRRFLVVFQLIIAIALLTGMPDPAEAQRERRAPQKQAQTPKTEPMRVMLVRENPESCQGECREWISAEGDLTPSTPLEFERVFRQLGNRKVPILIHSRGGSVEAAQRIGRMIRARGLDIAVARTWFKECGTGSLICPPPPPKQARKQRDRAPAAPIAVTGLPEFAGEHSRRRAGCASACSYLIAGGVRRVAAQHALVGVHQITTTRTHVMRRYIVHYRMINGRRQEVSRQLVSTRPAGTEVFQPAANDPAYRKVKAYLASLGVSGELVDLGMNSGPKQMHYLSREQLARTGVIDVGLSMRELFPRRDAQATAPRTIASRTGPLPGEETANLVIGSGALNLGLVAGKPLNLIFDVVVAPEVNLVDLKFRTAQGSHIPMESVQELMLRHGRYEHELRVILALRQSGMRPNSSLVTTLMRADLCTVRTYSFRTAALSFRRESGAVQRHEAARPALSWEKPLASNFCG